MTKNLASVTDITPVLMEIATRATDPEVLSHITTIAIDSNAEKVCQALAANHYLAPEDHARLVPNRATVRSATRSQANRL